MQISKKTALSSAVVLALGSASAFAGHAAEPLSTYFTYTNGGTTVNGGMSPPTGSWFSMLAVDTNTDLIPDANVYTAMRGTIAASPNLDAYTAPTGFGYIHFGINNTITVGAGGTNQNTGNMITRDWGFFGALGSEFTVTGTPLTVGAGCTQASTTCSVDMSGWRVTWNGIPSINMGTGAPAVMSSNDAIWGNGNDTLTYSAYVPFGDPSGFGGVLYAINMAGSFNPVAVPVPAAAWLFGSGLMGLAAVARRKKKA